MSERRYWIGVVSQDHVEAAVAQGFVQLGHGNARPLERMQPGDGFAFYSPRTTYPAGAPLQAFTAIGRIANGPIYASNATEGARTSAPANAADRAPANAAENDAEREPAFRRNATYFHAWPAPIKPLLLRLSFIRSKTHWGAAFRFGLIRIPREDFAAIATAMGRDADADFA